MSTSKFHSELVRRGFIISSFTTINRKIRKQLTKQGAKPTFSFGTSGPIKDTKATDENHVTWIASGHVDLSDLGFIDKTAEVTATLNKMKGALKRK